MYKARRNSVFSVGEGDRHLYGLTYWTGPCWARQCLHPRWSGVGHNGSSQFFPSAPRFHSPQKRPEPPKSEPFCECGLHCLTSRLPALHRCFLTSLLPGPVLRIHGIPPSGFPFPLMDVMGMTPHSFAFSRGMWCR